jgi:hypothetical protein
MKTAQEATMAKGQKKTNRETRKPKQDKPKPTPAPRSFLDPAGGGLPAKGSRR